MTQKKHPGLWAGAEARTPHEVETDPIGSAVPSPLQECPRPLASQQFPARKLAIMHAADRAELVRAAARFAFAAMFSRYVTGTVNNLSRCAVAAEIKCYARQSKVRGAMPDRYIADLVKAADAAAREFAC